MPVQSCSEGGKPGWRWGEQGKCYTYSPGDEGSSNSAKQKAHIQGAAIGKSEEILEAAIEVTEAAADLLKDFALSGGGTQLVPYDLAGQGSNRSGALLGPRKVTAAGIAVIAQDSGRVLMLQRSNDDKEDPARGKWEFPGGRCEDGETSWLCAQREWQEEMGLKLPPGQIAGQWDSSDGVYRGYVWLLDSEDQVDLQARQGEVNPDDPDNDRVESSAWFDPADLLAMPSLRAEVAAKTDWGLLRSFKRVKKALGELSALARYLRHGKSIEKFIPEWLPEKELVLVTRGMEAGSSPASACAASKARLLVKGGPPARASRRARQRELALRGVLTGTSKQLGRLAANAHRSHLSFIDSATQVLRDAYAQAYLIGKSHGQRIAVKGMIVKQDDGEDPEDASWDDLPDDVQHELAPDMDRQHQFLQGLSQDLVAGLTMGALSDRLDQYAAGAIPAYEEGYQDGAILALTPDDPTLAGGIMATWHVTSDDPCLLCEEKEGQVWPIDEAPLPGDGDFGEICKGAMNCRCVLEYEWMPEEESGVAFPAEEFAVA